MPGAPITFMTDNSLLGAFKCTSTLRGPAIITGELPGLRGAASLWKPSLDPRLPPSVAAAGDVWELDLQAAGIATGLPSHASAVAPFDERIELFIGGRRLWPARFPNVDPANATASYLRIGAPSGTNLTVVGWGETAGNRPATWIHTPLEEQLLNGYFNIGWADDVTPLSAINTTARHSPSRSHCTIGP